MENREVILSVSDLNVKFSLCRHDSLLLCCLGSLCINIFLAFLNLCDVAGTYLCHYHCSNH